MICKRCVAGDKKGRLHFRSAAEFHVSVSEHYGVFNTEYELCPDSLPPEVIAAIEKPLRDARQKIEKRRQELEDFISLYPEVVEPQTHLDEGTPERIYWHYGYFMACRDILKLLRSDSPSPHGINGTSTEIESDIGALQPLPQGGRLSRLTCRFCTAPLYIFTPCPECDGRGFVLGPKVKS
jgi:hypothetical protein